MMFFGKIESGELKIKNRAKMLEYMKTLPDGWYRLELKKTTQRSLPQNSYFHGVLIPEFRKALNGVGYNAVKTDDQCKRVIKSMFLTREISNEDGGKPIHFIQETHTLSKEEMTILIQEVIQFAAENLDYVIPLPGEKLQFDF